MIVNRFCQIVRKFLYHIQKRNYLWKFRCLEFWHLPRTLISRLKWAANFLISRSCCFGDHCTPVPVHVVGCAFDPDGLADPSCAILVLPSYETRALPVYNLVFSARMVCDCWLIVSLFRFLFLWASEVLLIYLITVLFMFIYPGAQSSAFLSYVNCPDRIDKGLCRLPGLCLAPWPCL